MAPVDVVRRFVTAINAHDVGGIVALMTDDHRFVDSLGAVVDGAARCGRGWRTYLKMVPDYQIDVHETCNNEGTVVLLGTAQGTYAPGGTLRPENLWQTPAAWRAIVRGDRVAEWQVYADNEPIRQRVAAHSAQQADAAAGPLAGR